jgi:hypothetical protein
MRPFGRGTLAAALATAMAVGPSVAPAQDQVAAKPASEAKLVELDRKPNVIRQAYEYSKTNPVVAIAILKGQKESLLTGEQVGDKLSEVLMKAYNGIPAKYFVEPGGDYTAVLFAVKGHVYGPYGLKDSLSCIALAADSYNEVIRPRVRASAEHSVDAAMKPEPRQ